MRRIDADELYLKAMRIINGNASDEAWAIAYAIAGAETVETEPIKHGKWLELWINHGIRYYTCSVCRANEISRKSHYCPDCGAKMNNE